MYSFSIDDINMGSNNFVNNLRYMDKNFHAIYFFFKVWINELK